MNDKQQLLTALTTEHFTLQGARSQTMSESCARASLYVLGVITFVRLLDCASEDFRYGMAINRIRGYYQEVAGNRADLFLLSGNDDATGVRENMALPQQGRTPIFGDPGDAFFSMRGMRVKRSWR